MLDGMEELTLEVSHLIPFIWFRCKGCFKDFPVIEYTYVACFKVAMWFVFVYAVWWFLWFTRQQRIHNLFKHLRWSFVKIGTSTKLKGFEYASAEWKVNRLARFCYIYIYIYIYIYLLQYILCLKSHAISLQLDFHSKP